MRVFCLFILFGILFFQSSNGQELKRNTIYFEAGGGSFFYSINFDRLLLKKDKHNLAVRVGIMYLPLFNDSERVFAGIPVGISYLKRINKNYLELGLSASAISDSYYLWGSDTYIEDLVLIGSTRMGIRHQPTDKRIFWNALFQFSLIVVGDQNNFTRPFEVSTMPLLSLGIGYSF